MSFTAIVPARLAATRLPNKPLADLGGKPMIVRVLEQAAAAGAARVIVATDAASIVTAVTAAGFEAVLTGAFANGTERVAAVAQQLELDGVIVNLQGDEPMIDPQLVAQVAERAASGACECTTAVAPIDANAAANPDIVKVICTKDDLAAYFSRTCIPHSVSGADAQWLGHLGIYAFAPGCLQRTTELAPCVLETTERLEQLRWLWHGWRINVVQTTAFFYGINTPADLAAAQANWDRN